MSVHVFDPQIAAEHGLVEAILIKNLQFWIEYNKANGQNLHDGRTWTYNSIRAFQDLFPYLGKKAIYNALKRLEAAGVIVTGNYSTNIQDRTIWYAFADEARWIFPKGKSNISPTGKSNISQKGKCKTDILQADKQPDSKPIPHAPARVAGVFVVGVDGVVVAPEIPVIPKSPPGAPAPEKAEIPARPAAKPPDGDWQRWVDRYEEHAKARNDGIGHNWTKVQLAALKGVRAHLVKVSTKAEGRTPDDCGFGAWCYVLDNWDALGDDWLKGQFDLCVLLKKITDILNRLKNAAAQTHRSPAGGRADVRRGTSEERNAALRDY